MPAAAIVFMIAPPIPLLDIGAQPGQCGRILIDQLPHVVGAAAVSPHSIGGVGDHLVRVDGDAADRKSVAECMTVAEQLRVSLGPARRRALVLSQAGGESCSSAQILHGERDHAV
jgi:hypothetical protein